MRSNAYPALPEGRKMLLVLPRTGDLRLRPQLPNLFAQRLFIHADPRRRLWYARFQLQRKFIVMSTQGDLYVKTSDTNFTINDLPKRNVLSMPRMARGDFVKAIDLVQCSRYGGQRWELVLTRWSNGMETWLPHEVVQLLAPDLLQEFYVNSINSWAFHARLQQGSLSAYRTEVELWLFHTEFQKFYLQLHTKRAANGTVLQSPHQSGGPLRCLPIKSEELTSSVVPHQAQAVYPSVPVLATTSDPSEAVIQAFEERRRAREYQEQLAHNRRQFLQQQLQQRIEKQQQQLQLEQEENLRQLQAQERNLRIQQQQKTHLEVQKKQKEYQVRLRLQQEREKIMDIQQLEQERRQRSREQEQLRRRLLQEQSRKEQSAKNQDLISKGLQSRKKEQNNCFPAAVQSTKDSHSKLSRSKGGDTANVPLRMSECEKSDDFAFSMTRKGSSGGFSSIKRRRKRLLYSQVNHDDDDGDDLADLFQLSSKSCQHDKLQDTSVTKSSCGKQSRKRKMLRLCDIDEGEKNIVDLSQLPENINADEITLTASAAPILKESIRGDFIAVECSTVSSNPTEDNFNDFDADYDLEPLNLSGRIRCICGALSAKGYRGQWLQCQNNDCNVWEHADCVGVLTVLEHRQPLKYLCTHCDSNSYMARCLNSSCRILDWLFQCCDSQNTKQLINLLIKYTGDFKSSSDWNHARYNNRSLAMHAARNNQVKGLCYLLNERKVDIFATDSQSRNVLHHAALGESILCCQELLKQEQKLLLQQDLRGSMPFHFMLQSAKLNYLCLPYMKEDASLVGMGDLNSNFPIHYACKALNCYTIAICRIILLAQASMLQERSSDDLYPLMILCKAADISNVTRNKAAVVNQVFESVKNVIVLMLDVDIFGDCLHQTASNGWTPLHFAAASGNHELVTYLCSIDLCNVHNAAQTSNQTALHIAAQNNHTLCVRALLIKGLDVITKDNDGWIPMLHAESAACIQEFMHYKLTKQLSRLHRMLLKFESRGIVSRWQRYVARDPTLFNILNDWCRRDLERIERMEGLLLSNPFLLRLDNKTRYVLEKIIQSIKKSPGKCSAAVENQKLGRGKQLTQNKLAFTFSRDNGSFWKQFVCMGMRLEPEDYRLPIIFLTNASSQDVKDYRSNLKLVLVHLAAGLLDDFPGLVGCGSAGVLETEPLSSNKDELAAQLLALFMLGQLTAHFVLFSVPFCEVLNFNAAFLRCIVCKGKYRLACDNVWENAGRCFSAGFEAVLPATLELFHADELSVLLYAPETKLCVLQINWKVVVDWNMCTYEALGGLSADNAKIWFPRLMSELVYEEQLLVLLFMAGNLQIIKDCFFQTKAGTQRIMIECFPETGSIVNHDAMCPMMEHDPEILRLPSYSCYDAFKNGFLYVIRHTARAFHPE
ncbi:hypothetical protein CCR75_005351 [Bremia lactucae]|uniref:HECT domain-containing protein n=1 Tax=Bremia lactucae TaxID=4779 RepID=A0A976FHX2_BRELC|nr:hypothetical protein CCR75_005351 [Bremia lactucae]